jgi:hypothetical protein
MLTIYLIAIGYLVIGALLLIWGAYDPISEQVDWTLSDGFGRPLLMWCVCIIIYPILLPIIIRYKIQAQKHTNSYKRHNQL